jgi:hypothetical protein
MEIVVRDTNAFKHFLEANNILFELNFKRTVRSYIILYGISILLIVTGFTKISDSGITTDYTNYTTHQHTVTREHFPINIFGSLGFGLLAVATYSLILNKSGKSRLMERISRYGKSTFREQNIKTTIFRDESIEIESPVVKSVYKWIAFSSYSLYNDFLVLKIGETPLEYVMINKTLMSDESFHEALAFIRKIVIEKKIRRFF